MTVSWLTDDQFFRLYGPWRAHTPHDAARLMDGYAGRWWIAGGWAIELFTGTPRPHDDLDIGVLAADLPLLRRHLAGLLDVWAAASGTLTPLVPLDRPGAPADEIMPAGGTQVWTRRDAASPWEYDILLSPGDAESWVCKRDTSMRMPWAEALWEHDGIFCLRPEIQLLYKAKGDRAKDHADLLTALPRLNDAQRGWLTTHLERLHPDHRWLRDLKE